MRSLILGKRWPLNLYVLITVSTIALLLAFFLSREALGVGSIQQQVQLETDKPIKHVRYISDHVDAETRELAERTANPELFDSWRQPQSIELGRFAARIMNTSRSSAFRHDVYYVKQLVIFVEFADGSKTIKVVDLPSKPGKELIVVRLP